MTSLALVPSASAATVAPSAAVPTGTWAYGAFQEVNLTGQTSNGTYTIHAAFGWQVLLTSTNTSATTYQVELVRTAAATINATFCSPNCNAALVSATLDDHVWETITAFSNFTTQATVNSSGASVPALGITNASAALAGNITERVTVQTSSLLHSKSAAAYFTAQASAQAQVAFTPALGLVPTNLTNGSSWDSQAAFAAGGSWAVSGFSSRTYVNGTSDHSTASAGGAVNGTGTVALSGSYGEDVDLDSHRHLPAVSLHLEGPFSLIEGVMLVPAGADLFGGGAGSDWGSNRNGPQTATTAGVDLVAEGAGHWTVLATSTSYDAGTSADVVASASPQPALSPMTPPVSSGPSTGAVIQAQPESVSAAQNGASCLLSSTGCASGGTSPVRFASATGLIALAAGAGLAVLLIGLVLGRRRVPTAPRPNASLYPPGAAGSPYPPATAAPGTTPPAPPAEEPGDDPLGHLW